METLFAHRGTVTEEGKLAFDQLDYWKNQLRQLSGKRFELTICEEKLTKTKEQLGFLFAGIIRAECKSSDIFKGWEEKEILQHLEMTLSTYLRVAKDINGNEVKKEVILEVGSMNRRQTAQFIEKVIAYLSQYGIIVKEPKDYKHG